MLLIEGFLSKPKLDELNQVLERTRFIPGQSSGGAAGSLIKNNLQHDPKDPNVPIATNLLMAAIQASPQLLTYAMATRITPLLFSRYGEGMAYADHVDSAVQSLPNMIVRTDISMTVFLADPSEYEGGELVVNMMGAERAVKGNAGDIFIYPTGVTHRVNPVRRGWRKVAIGWMQSMVVNHEHRELLYKLQTARAGLLKAVGRSAEFELVNDVHENLLRLFTQP